MNATTPTKPKSLFTFNLLRLSVVFPDRRFYQVIPGFRSPPQGFGEPSRTETPAPRRAYVRGGPCSAASLGSGFQSPECCAGMRAARDRLSPTQPTETENPRAPCCKERRTRLIARSHRRVGQCRRERVADEGRSRDTN